MCGIAGFAGPGSPDSLRGVVGQMVSSLARRGPDSEGIESWDGAVLGHRRLAILDLSDAGRQPMLSDDRQTGIVFNGCIYNFMEIRAELERAGHRFHSRCDTEVLVRGYEEWGVDRLVPKLRGMFAFAIWDHRARKMILVRDRLGVKPLVYVARHGSLGFASTTTALHDAGLAGDVSPEAVLDVLEFDWVTEQRTIFEHARKVPAGTIIEWRDGEISERSYWSLPEPETRQISFDEAVEHTESLLIEAAQLRLISDVPIGALLSGGIDSALMCWAMSKLGANISSYTVSTPGDPADESAAAEATAHKLGIPHRTVALPASEQPALDDLADAYGEPFACGSALGMLRVSKAVKPSATVLLTGDGGDDVFLGYQRHKMFFMAQRLAPMLPASVASGWPTLEPLSKRVAPLRRAWRFVSYAAGGMGAVREAHDGLPWFAQNRILGGRFSSTDRFTPAGAHPPGSGKRLLRDVLNHEFQNRFPAEFMTKVDGASMYYGIEARSPFLDHRLWEFAASLPFGVRLHGGELKAVLRAIARKRIGPEVASRGKQGFHIPVGRWLAGQWKSQMDIIAHDSLLEEEGWIERGQLRQLVRTAVEAGTVPRQLWSLLVLERWLQRHASRTPAKV